jgi:HK97 family phage major capsid protein
MSKSPEVEFADLRAKRTRMLAERRQLADRAEDEMTVGTGLANGIVERIENIDTGIAKVDTDIERMLEQVKDVERQRIADAVTSGRARVVRGTFGYDDDDPRPVRSRDDARRTLDDVHTRTSIGDDALTRAEQLLNTPDPRARQVASDWVRTTGSPDYEQAFLKLMADPTRGHLLWTEREAAAFREAELVRAMSLTDASGGFMVPFQLDPSIILTSAGSINPLRQISGVVTATSDVWNGVSSAGSTSEWIAEATEVADGSPTLAQPAITIHKFDCFIPYSFEVGMDGASFLEEIGVVMRDSVDQLQATAFTTGTGTGQPWGVVQTLVGGGSVVASAGADVFARADVFAVQNALPARFSARAQWCANLATINAAAQFELSTGSGPVFPEIKSDQLLRKPLNELSNMDEVNAGQENYILLYGDFSHYVIADRIGATLELIPNLVGANRRPTGQWGRSCGAGSGPTRWPMVRCVS